MQLKSCFGFDTFFATDVRRFGDGGIFIGNLRKPIDDVIPKLEKKLSEAAGREVVVWFMEEKANDITKQVLTFLSISHSLQPMLYTLPSANHFVVFEFFFSLWVLQFYYVNSHRYMLYVIKLQNF